VDRLVTLKLHSQAANEHERRRLGDGILTASQLRQPRPPSARSLHFPPPSAVAESAFRGLSSTTVRVLAIPSPLLNRLFISTQICSRLIYDRYVCLDVCSIKSDEYREGKPGCTEANLRRYQGNPVFLGRQDPKNNILYEKVSRNIYRLARCINSNPKSLRSNNRD